VRAALDQQRRGGLEDHAAGLFGRAADAHRGEAYLDGARCTHYLDVPMYLWFDQR
jgi:hypothetical protein